MHNTTELLKIFHLGKVFSELLLLPSGGWNQKTCISLNLFINEFTNNDIDKSMFILEARIWTAAWNVLRRYLRELVFTWKMMTTLLNLKGFPSVPNFSLAHKKKWMGLSPNGFRRKKIYVLRHPRQDNSWYTTFKLEGSLVELVEQQPATRCVVGSIPSGSALKVWSWTSVLNSLVG